MLHYEPEDAQIFIDPDRLAALGLRLDDLAPAIETLPWMHAAFTENEVRRAAARGGGLTRRAP